MIQDSLVVAMRIQGIGTVGFDSYYDLSQHIRSIFINRGKSSTFGSFPVSTVVIQFNNQDRTFDPTLTSTQLGEFTGFSLGGNPVVQPIMWNPQNIMGNRKLVEIGFGVFSSSLGIISPGNSSGEHIFRGYTYDWNLSYTIDGQSIATLTLHDFSGLFSKIRLGASTPVVEYSGERFSSVYNANIPGGIPNSGAGQNGVGFVDPGTVELGTQPIEEGTALLDYINLIATTEGGSTFQNRDGRQVFRQKLTSTNPDYLKLGIGEIGIMSLTVSYGTELLYNQIKVQNIGGASVQVDDLGSQNQNGIKELELAGLLGANDTEAESLATFYATNYSTTKLRFEEVEVSVSKYDQPSYLSDTQLKLVYADIGDFVNVKYRPNDIGDTISQGKEIIGITHRITPNDYSMSFVLDDARKWTLILDDAVFGKLDEYRLA
jgi:hypothetical protein